MTRIRKTRGKRRSMTVVQQVCHPNAAGADIGSEEIVIAVPAELHNPSVETFGTFNEDLRLAVAWLVKLGVRTLAMESTGNYWVAFFDLLREAGLEVFVVNARHVKGVPGRKTDVCDAQWIQQLHTAGLLSASFVPEEDVRHMRYLYRHREDLVRANSEQIHHMQKVLNEMNVQIHHVISDLDGWSGQRIIDAIIEGERDPRKLAALRHSQCRTAEEDIIKALDGNYRREYVFVLKQVKQRWRQILHQIAEVEKVIGEMLGIYGPQAGEIEHQEEPCTGKGKSRSRGKGPKKVPKQKGKHEPCFDIRAEGRRILKVDVTEIPSISSGVLGVLLTEIGGPEQLSKGFKNGKRFASWLGLCPDKRISGGKLLGTKTRKVRSRLARMLRLAAVTLWRSDTALGDYCRRMKARLGKAEGITATAHKLARILYAVITTGQPYDENVAMRSSAANAKRRIRNIKRQAARLGLQVVEPQQA